jgi:transcriptional regulator with XRE-family HTH domain
LYIPKLAASGKSASLQSVRAARSLKEHFRMSARLPNYLKTYRKRTGFSQDEFALLLGSESGAKVSRYECWTRCPSLETALAYEAILGVPTKELFAGLYQKVEKRVAQRIERLGRRLTNAEPGKTTIRKLAFLQALQRKPLSPQDSRP